MSKRYRVGRASAGLGLFALTTFRRGQFIIEYKGRRLPNAEAEKINNRYLFGVDRKWTIDGSDRSNIARYINHSCKPNAVAYIEQGRVRIRARRKIFPGEEITFNYGKEYFDVFITKKNCRCAACRRR